MSQIAKEGKKTMLIRNMALHLVKGVEEKNWRLEVKRIFEFVRDKIRYVKDIRGVETLSTPTDILKMGQGDCDDKSILVASLLESIGHPTRFIAAGFNNLPYSHVFTQTKIGNKWVTLECTENWPLGRTPPSITSKLTRYN